MQVKQWMKKSLVILISVLTLGLVTPDDIIWSNGANAEKPEKKSFYENETENNDVIVTNVIELEEKPLNEKEQILINFQQKAEEVSYLKFGDRIKPRIEEEFNEVILPKMQETIASYIESCPNDDLAYLTISENPSSGLGEKIFHVYNSKTGEDLIRFHVRRENPPQQGHWFNFHYHTNEDQFVTHHDLGSIYWDKNTPPNWNLLS